MAAEPFHPHTSASIGGARVQCQVCCCLTAGADPGGPQGPGPPLTLGFEAPKLNIFGPYFIFP